VWPVERARNKGKEAKLFRAGEMAVLFGADVRNALARHHVLLLCARVSKQNGQAAEAVTLSLSHSATSSCGIGHRESTLETVYSATLSRGSRCGRDLGLVKKMGQCTNRYRVTATPTTHEIDSLIDPRHDICCTFPIHLRQLQPC